MGMTTSLKPIGQDLAVIIDRSTLDALGIDETTRLEVSVDGGSIRIKPATDSHREDVLASARKMMEIHDEAFRKLAL